MERQGKGAQGKANGEVAVSAARLSLCGAFFVVKMGEVESSRKTIGNASGKIVLARIPGNPNKYVFKLFL